MEQFFVHQFGELCRVWVRQMFRAIQHRIGLIVKRTFNIACLRTGNWQSNSLSHFVGHSRTRQDRSRFLPNACIENWSDVKWGNI